MKIIKLSEIGNRPFFQGDIMLKISTEKPTGEPSKSKIVAHSESGHHHTAEHAIVFDIDPMTMFLKPDGKGFIDDVPYVDIVHHRPMDTHETYRVLFDIADAGVKIKRQREMTPTGWRRVED